MGTEFQDASQPPNSASAWSSGWHEGLYGCLLSIVLMLYSRLGTDKGGGHVMVRTKETAERPGGSHILLIASRSHPGSFGVFVKCSHIQSNMQNYNQCKSDKPIGQKLNPLHLFPILGLLGGNIMQQFLQARSCQDSSYSIHHSHSLKVDQVVFANEGVAHLTVVEWPVPR